MTAAHKARGLGIEDHGAVARSPVAKVQLGERQQVADRRAYAAERVAGAGEVPRFVGAKRAGPVAVVAKRDRVHDRVLGERDRRGGTERIEQPGAQHCVVALTGKELGQTAEHRKSAVAI